MNNYKYLYNKGTKKLHIINGCCHSRNNNSNDTNIKFIKAKMNVLKNTKHILKNANYVLKTNK